MKVKLLNLNTTQVDYLNIGLILVSLLIAFYLPFTLFLIAYAVLGPLHYLTEINWLNERKFFVNSNRWFWIVALLSVIIIIPLLLQQPLTWELIGSKRAESWYYALSGWSNGAIFFWLVLSAGLIITRRWYLLGVFALIGIGGAYLLKTLPLYMTIMGFLVPTLIHVYLFTLLFMFFGTQKSKSIPGYIAIALALLAPVLIILIDVNPNNFRLSENTMLTFVDNNFHLMNVYLAELLGLVDENNANYLSSNFQFLEVLALKIQIFIAFAYTYHYLNWFSKTSVIGWHKMSRKRSLIILALWMGMVSIYAYDYKTGFFVALFLSFLHVLLEFPLNALTVKNIGISFGGVFRK